MKMLAAISNVKFSSQEHRKEREKNCCFLINYFLIYIHMRSQRNKAFQYVIIFIIYGSLWEKDCGVRGRAAYAVFIR